MKTITTIGLDADDTLWHNERFFKFTQARFAEMLAGHAAPDVLAQRLLAVEKKNLNFYGFGIKGFTLSMIETAVDVTDGNVPATTIRHILEAGREMLHHPVELLPQVRETLEVLAPHYRLVLITKGDLFDQERKLAQSGLGELFSGIEIVSDKTPAIYDSAFRKYGDGPEHALMAGNSLKSDVLPALAAGAFGVHIPHALTWEHEHADAPHSHPRFREVAHINLLPDLLAR
jgi:putative hydrolase of the HAD superfamily